MRVRYTPILVAVLASIALSGCSLLKKPDMTRTSSIAELRQPQRPLIFIPGFLGTKLRDPQTDRVVWGRMTNVLMGGDSDDLALAVGPGQKDVPGERVEPYAIYDRLWGIEYYGKILRTLRSAGGYRIGDIENPRPGDNAFVFIYDWRRDNVESARHLAEAIEGLKQKLGDTGMTFDLLTHSQGGLIARYYVKYGGAPLHESGSIPRPTMAGAGNIGKVVMLGTPNRGCLQALKILHVGVKKVFRPIRPEVIFTMPSIYQMLPPRGSVLFADIQGRPIDLDVYDADVWKREGWSIFSSAAQRRLSRRLRRNTPGFDIDSLNLEYHAFLRAVLERADRFHEALEAPAEEGEVTYHAFGSDCNPTLKAAILVEKGKGRQPVFDKRRLRSARVADRLEEVLYGAGDGTVLMQSLLAIPDGNDATLEIKSAFFFCDDHGVLGNNPIFQNNLFYVLLWDDAAAPQGSSQATSFTMDPSLEATKPSLLLAPGH